jgi:hypothetical protein
MHEETAAAENEGEAEDEVARQRIVNRFIDELLAATARAPLTLVLTLRGDFYNEVLAHRGLSQRLQSALVNLGPMTRDELDRAVNQPAEKAGLDFESGLVDRLLDDAGEEPGNLPLMEFALKELWEARQANRLLNDVYTDMGGVKGAIAERAEAVYQGLDATQQHRRRHVSTRAQPAGDLRPRWQCSRVVPQRSRGSAANPTRRRWVSGRPTGFPAQAGYRNP